MKGLNVIPVHDEIGQLVAYAGRYSSKEVPEGETKHKFPPGFKKDLVLYNLHRAKETVKDHLFLVEGFFDVFHLWQNKVNNVVALMGVSISKQQDRLLINTLGKDGRLSLMMDKDDAGKKVEKKISERLIDMMLVRAET